MKEKKLEQILKFNKKIQFSVTSPDNFVTPHVIFIELQNYGREKTLRTNITLANI